MLLSVASIVKSNELSMTVTKIFFLSRNLFMLRMAFPRKNRFIEFHFNVGSIKNRYYTHKLIGEGVDIISCRDISSMILINNISPKNMLAVQIDLK